MPAAWISAGVGLLGAANSLSGSSSSGVGQVASGAANIAGGALSASEAQQFANQLGQTANPFGQYNQQFGQQLAGQTSQGGFGNNFNPNLSAQSVYTGTATGQLVGSLNGASIGNQLTNLINDPSSIYSTPQYQSAFNQGQSAVNSTLAAQGLNASGNQLAALQSYGQTFGQNAYNTQVSQLSGLYGQALGANQQAFGQLSTTTGQSQQQNQQAFNQLSQLSGLATGSPTAAAAAQAQVYGQVNSAYGSVGTGIGQVASGAGNLLNGLSNTGTTGFTSGLGTTTSGFSDVSGSGSLFGTSAGMDSSGFNYSGGNSFGFTE